MARWFNLLAVGIDEVELQSAELRALPPVGTAMETILRSITLSGVTHAERAMHKRLEFHPRHLPMNLSHLGERQFAGEHHPLESHRCEPCHL